MQDQEQLFHLLWGLSGRRRILNVEPENNAYAADTKAGCPIEEPEVKGAL